jgi:predicted RNA-binding protein YlqC (UPF0109 family)
MMYDHFEAEAPETILKGIIQALVAYPEEVEILKTDSPGSTVLTIDVVSEDRGKIIGRGGSIIKSLTTLFRALGGKIGKQIFLEIQEEYR